MSIYYTVLTAISCSILVVMNFLVMENDRIEKQDKNKFYLTYAFIAAAALCEYASVALNGTDSSHMAIHSLVKSLDYMLTPAAGIFFVHQLTGWDRIQRYVKFLVAANGIMALISNFTGWYFYLDEANVYHHGSLHFLYIAVYILMIVFSMYEFLHYAHKFAHRNYISIISIWLFMIGFISVQEAWNSAVRVDYLILSISCVMIFAHYCQYRLQESIETITHQQNLLERDPLTDLYNRYAYIQTLEDYEKQDYVPSELIAISIDINGLKKVNDSLGHQAGDDLICGAAKVILDTFSPYGKCFRTGGDEFIVILNLLRGKDARSRCKELLASLQEAATSWKGEIVTSISLSCGFASAADHPDVSVEKLVSIADTYMYENKEAYYFSCGKRR